MTPPSARRDLVFLSALMFSLPHLSRAQAPQDSAHVENAGERPISAWASFGLGPGSLRGGGTSVLASAVRGTVTGGPALLTYRREDVGPFFTSGSGVRSDALLIGARTGHRRLFASLAGGYASAAAYHQCENCGRNTVAPRVDAFAYDAMLHANAVVAGLAVGFSGLLGAPGIAHTDFTISFELGWFGLRR
jgi:hypothetical protein